MHDHDVDVTEHEQRITEIKKYYYLYPKDPDRPVSIQSYITENIKKIGEMDENGISEGELHYEFLLESLGLHQVINFPVLDQNGEYVDWSGSGRTFGTVSELYNVNAGSDEEGVMADYRYRQKSIDEIEITGDSRLECVAGGNGIITAKTSTSVEVEYPDENLKITYACASSISGMTNERIVMLVRGNKLSLAVITARSSIARTFTLSSSSGTVSGEYTAARRSATSTAPTPTISV